VPAYKIPETTEICTLENALNFLHKQLPDTSNPEIFGLHPNAAISGAIYECDFMINCLTSLGSGASVQVLLFNTIKYNLFIKINS